MKVLITKREPHPVKFETLEFGDCFQYKNVETNESFIGIVTQDLEFGTMNLSDSTPECLYDNDLVHKVEVKIVNEI